MYHQHPPFPPQLTPPQPFPANTAMVVSPIDSVSKGDLHQMSACRKPSLTRVGDGGIEHETGSVLYPPIQEERRIRSNIARGPKGRGQYYSVSSSPLGLGGTIQSLCITLSIFRHAIKVNIATVPVTGPRRKRCLNIDQGYVPQAIRVSPPI